MIAASPTKGLHKLSKAEQEQAKAGDACKYMQNAAGHAVGSRRQVGPDEEVPVPERRRTEKNKGNFNPLETSRT